MSGLPACPLPVYWQFCEMCRFDPSRRIHVRALPGRFLETRREVGCKGCKWIARGIREFIPVAAPGGWSDQVPPFLSNAQI